MKSLNSFEMKSLLFPIVCMLVVLSPISASAVSPNVNNIEIVGYDDYVRIYMKATLVHETLAKTLETQFLNARKKFNFSKEECHELAEGIVDYIYDDLVKSNVETFRRYYTLSQMKRICNFVKTDSGQKYAICASDLRERLMGNAGLLAPKMSDYLNDYMKTRKKSK